MDSIFRHLYNKLQLIKQDKVDNTLTTSSKEISGAINEINELDVIIRSNDLDEEITDIIPLDADLLDGQLPSYYAKQSDLEQINDIGKWKKIYTGDIFAIDCSEYKIYSISTFDCINMPIGSEIWCTLETIPTEWGGKLRVTQITWSGSNPTGTVWENNALIGVFSMNGWNKIATSQDLEEKADKHKTVYNTPATDNTLDVLNNIKTFWQLGYGTGRFRASNIYQLDLPTPNEPSDGVIDFYCNNYHTIAMEVTFMDSYSKTMYYRTIDVSTWTWVEPKWITFSTTDKVDIQLLNGWVVDSGRNPIITKTGNHVSIVGSLKNGINCPFFNVPVKYGHNSTGITQYADVLFSNNVKERMELLVRDNGDVTFRLSADAARVINGSTTVNFNIQYDIF